MGEQKQTYCWGNVQFTFLDITIDYFKHEVYVAIPVKNACLCVSVIPSYPVISTCTGRDICLSHWSSTTIITYVVLSFGDAE